MRFVNPFARSVPLAAAFALAACVFSTDDKVAGGAQDFPNTVTLGAAASTHIGDHADWDQFSVIPNGLPTFADAESLVVAPETSAVKPKLSAGGLGAAGADGTAGAVKTAALGKPAAGAAADTAYWDLSDTAALQVARLIRRSETAFKAKGDTLTWIYAGKVTSGLPSLGALLESKGAETVLATGRRTAYRYENTDSAGALDRATFLQRLPAFLPAGFKYRLLVVKASPAGGFDLAAGALPAYYAYARTRTVEGAAPDTAETFEISDADGDGTLWGAGDSGVVDFRQKLPNPAGRPAVEMIAQRMRAILFKEESRTYPVSFRETRTEKDGKKVVFSVRGVRNGEDSTFLAGDTAWVTVHTDYPESAKMAEKTARYKVRLGGEPRRFADNLLLRYSLEAVWHKGDSLASTKFVFVPEHPAPASEMSISGGLDLLASLANGHRAHAVGSFLDKLIEADVADTAADGKVRAYHAKWTAQGVPISQKPLP